MTPARRPIAILLLAALQGLVLQGRSEMAFRAEILAKGRGGLLLQVGSDWCVSGNRVRETFDGKEFRKAVASDIGAFAVFDDRESPTPASEQANARCKDLCLRTYRYPALFCYSKKGVCGDVYENIPQDVTAQQLAEWVREAVGRQAATDRQVEAARRESDKVKRTSALGRAFAQVVDRLGPERAKHELAYGALWQEVESADPEDRLGFRLRFASDSGFGIVRKATELAGTPEGEVYLAQLRTLAPEDCGLLLQQAIDMAEFALRRKHGLTPPLRELLHRVARLDARSIWGECARGYLKLGGEPVETTPQVKRRPLPRRGVRLDVQAFRFDQTKLGGLKLDRVHHRVTGRIPIGT